MSDLPDPRTIRSDPPPEGCHYEWVPEPVFGWLAWRVVPEGESRQCRDIDRGRRCTAQSVAKLQRSRKPAEREQWWHYCAEHAFGRWVSGQRVWRIHAIPDDEQIGGVS